MNTHSGQEQSAITDVPGIKVGHAQDEKAKTGCTVILCEGGAVGGVDVRGSAPGTREIEALKPVRLVPEVHGVLFAGGSAFGLDAAGGVQHCLEERGVGYDVGVARVPIVPAAVIFDLRVGDPKVRPDRAMGYAAAKNASTDHPAEGLVGVGIGASAGRIAGEEYAGRGGVGTTARHLNDTVMIGALAVANPLGNVVDPKGGRLLVGHLDRAKWTLPRGGAWLSSTILAVVATNAKLSKEEAVKVAEMAQDGIARAVYPAHTMYDGDVTFALSTGSEVADVNAVGDMAAELVGEAIARAVVIANGLK